MQVSGVTSRLLTALKRRAASMGKFSNTWILVVIQLLVDRLECGVQIGKRGSLATEWLL